MYEIIGEIHSSGKHRSRKHIMMIIIMIMTVILMMIMIKIFNDNADKNYDNDNDNYNDYDYYPSHLHKDNSTNIIINRYNSNGDYIESPNNSK